MSRLTHGFSPQGNTPHWDTPYGTPKPGGGSKLLIVLIVLVAGGGLMCLLCMLLGVVAGQEDTGLRDNRPDLQASAVPTSTQSVESQVKNAELAKLEETHSKVERVIARKLEPVIERFKKQLRENRDELVKLKDKKPLTNGDKYKIKRYLEERKEIKRYLKTLLDEREKYQTQLTELEFTVRRVKRNLEVSEFIDKKDRADIEKLLARGSALIESADKGFDQGSLESEVENAGGDEHSGGEVEVDMGELDAALGE